LDRAKDEFCFSPAESVEQRLQIRATKRTTAMSCGNRRGSNRKQNPKRKPGSSFSTGSYGRAIAYACKKAGLPVWSPNQLRHAVATRLRDTEGIESASLILGHRHLSTSEIYAEKSERKALEIAQKHG
jgi:integrase